MLEIKNLCYNGLMNLLKGVGEFCALDIGTNSIRLIQLSGDSKRGFVLSRYAYVPVDPKVVQDDSKVGRRKMGEAILGAVEQAGIRTKNIAIGLPARKTFTAIIEVPNAPEKELGKTIKYEADKYIPMAVDEAKIDYAVLGVSPNDPKKAEILLSSTASSYAEERLEMIESLGFNVIAQEPEPIAMARALMPVETSEARLLIDLGEKSTDLVMVYEGAPRLVRTIPGGLAVFVKTAVEAFSVKEDQARQFILRFGLAQDKLDGQVLKALKSTLEIFVTEITKSIKFFHTKYGKAKVSGITLTGFAGVIPFMSEYIEAKIGVQTAQGNSWQYVKVTPEQQQQLLAVASEFGVAIGLAERSND